MGATGFRAFVFWLDVVACGCVAGALRSCLVILLRLKSPTQPPPEGEELEPGCLYFPFSIFHSPSAQPPARWALTISHLLSPTS